MSKLNIREQGFTLLELLLVLALTSILILGALAMYQIQLRNFKVDKTSLQMQQWLQAGMSFYVDCDKWPNDSTQDDNIISAMMGKTPLTQDECPKYADTTRQYMPLNSDKNGPFPNEYSFGPFVNANGNVGTMFQVSTTIGDDSTLMESVGRMIASRLPNATSFVDDQKTPETVAVQATINVPGQAVTDSGHGFILNMQMVNSTALSQVKAPTQKDCPNGMVPILVNAISNFQSLKVGLGSGHKTGAYIATTAVDTDQSTHFVRPTLSVQPDDNTYGGAPETTGVNEVLLISACIPKEGK